LRILIVTPSIPYPPNWGFGIRVYQIVRELSRRHTVSVVCYSRPGEEDKIAALQAVCHSVHTVQNPLADRRAKRRAQLTAMVGRTSFQTASLRTAAMQRLVTSLVTAEHFDLVQFESSQMCSLKLPADVPWIVDEHNLEYELLQRMGRTERSPIRKLFNWVEHRKFKREEMSSWERADACVVTSEREARVVVQHVPHKPIHVAANGVDIEFFAPCDDPADTVDPDEMVFTGLLSYRPNADAVTYFVKQVLPLIVARRPRARFTVVGLDAPAEVTRLAGPNVDIVGAVPDVRPYVRRAAMFVVPLRMGSGTRLKILEGLAAAKGVVSTTVGCEGINVVADEHLLVADTAAALADAVVALQTDPARAAELGAAGRRLVEDHYSWVSIVHELEDFYRTLVERPRQS
jgi:polysaccharide biosynthesis protein PslH